jgi:hypothetical protein
VRLAAIVIAIGVLAGGSSAATPRVLGFDWQQKRLAWVNPTNLAVVGKTLPAARTACSWSFAPDHRRFVYSDCDGTLRFVDTKAMKLLGSMQLGYRLGSVDGLTWLRPDRLLALAHVDALTTLLVIDPNRRRVLRRTDLARSTGQRSMTGGRMVVMLSGWGSFEPVRVAVIDADGNMRVATVDRIQAGTIVNDGDESAPPSARTTQPGFAVDSATGRAFVVSPDMLIAVVDLQTLDVSYHGATRSLAKAIDGPSRWAAWLGGGLLAVSGVDYSTSVTGAQPSIAETPYGLHIVDTRTWTIRTIDPDAIGFVSVPGALVASHSPSSTVRETFIWGLDGTLQRRFSFTGSTWLDIQGGYGYVCNVRALVSVVDPSSGATIARTRGRACLTLAAAPNSAA